MEKPFAIHMKFKFEKPLPGGYATFTIRNHLYEVVFFSDNKDNRESLKFDNPGVIEAVVDFPAPMLVPGKYTISSAIACQGKEATTGTEMKSTLKSLIQNV